LRKGQLGGTNGEKKEEAALNSSRYRRWKRGGVGKKKLIGPLGFWFRMPLAFPKASPVQGKERRFLVASLDGVFLPLNRGCMRWGSCPPEKKISLKMN